MLHNNKLESFSTSTNLVNGKIQRDIAINFSPKTSNNAVLQSNANESTVPWLILWLKKYENFDIDELRGQIWWNGTVTDKWEIVEVTIPNSVYSVWFGRAHFFKATSEKNDESKATISEKNLVFNIGYSHVIRIEGVANEVRQNMNYQRIELQ